MANRTYTNARAQFMQGGIDMAGGNVKVVLVSAGYVFSDAHTSLADIAGGNRLATSGSLASKTFAGAVFDAADVVLSAVAGPTPGVALVVYLDTGVEATSLLIAYIDGRAQVQVAAQADVGATSVVTEDLPHAVASGATLTRVSGAGPATLTLSAGAAVGARALSVVATTGSNLVAGSVLEYPIQDFGLPITPDGGDILIAWNAGPDRIFALRSGVV